MFSLCRLCTIRSTPQPVMCGVLGVSCMRYGVSDTNHLKATPIQTYVNIIHHTNSEWCYNALPVIHTDCETDRQWMSPGSAPWLSQGNVSTHDYLLVLQHSLSQYLDKPIMVLKCTLGQYAHTMCIQHMHLSKYCLFVLCGVGMQTRVPGLSSER